MPEQLLDRAEVGTALQQVGGEGVAQAMRIREQATERGGVERTSPGGEEEGVLCTPSKLWPSPLEIEPEPVSRFLTERHGALLASLPTNEDGLLLEVDVGEPEVDRLLCAETRRLDELE
jgi:hypothetical protein